MRLEDYLKEVINSNKEDYIISAHNIESIDSEGTINYNEENILEKL